MMWIVLLWTLLSCLLVSFLSGRLGWKVLNRILLCQLWFVPVCSLVGMMTFVWKGSLAECFAWNWFECGGMGVAMSLKMDALSVSMSVLVSGVSALVLLFSLEYMLNDASRERFIMLVLWFEFFMLLLVLSDNMVLMFVGWEGVGIVSYLLVLFWCKSLDGNKSAWQALLVNRVGDVCLLLALSWLWSLSGSLDLSLVNVCLVGETSRFGIGMLLLLASSSKSAQLGLHVWLPNAMSAPTPISALLHAATMVTAGVFLLVRMSAMLELSGLLCDVMCVLGSLSLVVMGSIGVLQSDIKKIVAYSTGSQLGYMVLGCGLGAFDVSLLHVLNHGVFKALLFLGSGMVIASLQDEQDVRRMGGLRVLLPLSYVAIVVGSVGLSGLPYLAGYYSKDVLLEVSLVRGLNGNMVSLLGYGCGVFGAFLTSVYSVRLLALVFVAYPSGNKEVHGIASESGWKMSLPLGLLSVLTLVVGYVLKERYSGVGVPSCTNELGRSKGMLLEAEFLDVSWKWLPSLVSLSGLLFYGIAGERSLLTWKYDWKQLWLFVNRRWLFDKMYNVWLIQPVMCMSLSGPYKSVDKGVLEWCGPLGATRWLLLGGRLHRSEGEIWNYMLLLGVGAVGGLMLM